MCEGTNANGSKKFREALLEGDWDSCVAMAREQEKGGAHVLDVCVDYVRRDGSADMDEIASRFATQATVPLMIDSNGRASCRDRVCTYVEISVVAVSLKKKKKEQP